MSHTEYASPLDPCTASDEDLAMRVITSACSVGVAALLLVSCGDDGSARIAELEAQLTSVTEEMETATQTASDLQVELDETVADLTEARSRNSELAQERDDALDAQKTAEDRATEAEAAAIDLRNRYDPQIQRQVEGVQADAEARACATATQEATEQVWQRSTVDPDITAAVRTLPEDLQDAARERIDRAAVKARADQCFAETQASVAAAELVTPKGDGFWTVGVEIAAGVWRSNGTGDGCYWQISPTGVPDDIIDNHFGNAGGTVTLRDGQEFESDDCGLWEKVG